MARPLHCMVSTLATMQQKCWSTSLCLHCLLFVCLHPTPQIWPRTEHNIVLLALDTLKDLASTYNVVNQPIKIQVYESAKHLRSAKQKSKCRDSCTKSALCFSKAIQFPTSWDCLFDNCLHETYPLWLTDRT